MKETKTIFITGATSGIGEATALLFAENGWRIAITGRRADRLETLSKSLLQKGAKDVLSLVFDVQNREETFKILGELESPWNAPDVLVNNAGLAAGRASIEDTNPHDWDRMIDTNVKGVLNVTHMLLPGMKSRGKGHIVVISSTAGKEVYKDGNVYCASKHAADALTRAMRIDLLPYGLRVTSISPGMVETEFSLVRFNGDKQKASAVYKGFTPLSPHDIADAVHYAVTRPAHVGINDIVITPTAQANSFYTHKKEL
jgi:NADP-dependent 3-hydroxy acid dehydrogenase YdfG